MTAGFEVVEHTVAVPLDHDRPDGPRISLHAREVRAPGGERLPWLLYLNGGPGFPAPRPSGTSGWLRRATEEYRVLLLDQRGTGRSTPLTRRSLADRGDVAAQAEHLRRFRADSIVADAERIRRALGVASWSVLGQSFGGFCAVTYLSFAPEGLREVFITGGLPGLPADAATAYRALYPVVAARNAAHYARHPEDAERAGRLAAHLREHDVRLPGGRRLTVAALQSLGGLLGRGTGSDDLHNVLEQPFDGERVADEFLLAAHRELSWASAKPLYSVLHEATYADGGGPTGWAALRVRDEHPEFDPDRGDPLHFTGEVVFPETIDDDPLLCHFGPAARLLAERDDWPRLYDLDRLRANEVPVTAAVYAEDMYVARDLSLETARLIRGAEVWLTDEYQHDGLRTSEGAVLGRLLAQRSPGRTRPVS